MEPTGADTYVVLKTALGPVTVRVAPQTQVRVGELTGLVVNELLTNALKHAFTGREGGTWSYEVFLEPKNVAVSLGGHHIPHWGA